MIRNTGDWLACCRRSCGCQDSIGGGTRDSLIKSFIAERGLNAATRYIPKPTVRSLRGGFEEKIAIIGAGSAGLSCAYYPALTGYKPAVFEKNDEPGGMLRYGIP